MADVTLPYKPRPFQAEIHANLARFNVLVIHRRAGKTVLTINQLSKDALTCTKPRPRCHYIAPLYRQAKQVAWDYVIHFASPIPGVQFNQAELRADFPNGGRLQLFGADNYHALRGIYSDAMALDEFAQFPPAAWGQVLRPALADRHGKAYIIGTPFGRSNQFHKFYQDAEDSPDWWRCYLRPEKTGALDKAELLALKRDMTPEEYEQEILLSWEAAIRGAFYGKEMTAAELDGRVRDVPYDKALPVITSWDLGLNDATCIWYWQTVGSEIRAIDLSVFQSTGLPDIIKHVKEKPYIYGEHIGPHDIKTRELGTGVSRQEVARGLGIEFTVVKQLPVLEGIDAVRAAIPRMFFDSKKCRDGIEALKGYRTEFIEKRSVFSKNPLHSWESDYCDSVRYFILGAGGARYSAELDYTRANRGVI